MLTESGASYTFALGVALIWAQLLKYAHSVFTQKYSSASEWMSEPLVKSDVEWDGCNPFFTDHPSYILGATEEAAGERPPLGPLATWALNPRPNAASPAEDRPLAKRRHCLPPRYSKFNGL